jgi:hypothetical protein
VEELDMYFYTGSFDEARDAIFQESIQEASDEIESLI